MSTTTHATATWHKSKRALPWAPAIDVAAIALLLFTGVSSFGPVFSGAPGYVAAGGGALLGLIIGAVASRMRWAFFTTASVVMIVYLLFGGALALPSTTIARVVPTLETVQRLVLLTYQSWRDLLTVSVPANAFTGPAVVPYLAGMLCALVAVRLALRPQRHLWALIPAALLLLIGILWGTKTAPQAAFMGGIFALVAMGWAAWRVSLAQHRANAHLLTGTRTNTSAQRQRAIAGAGILVLGSVVGLTLGNTLAHGTDRYVLRDSVVPPLDLQNYASPLTRFRYYVRNLKEKPVLEVAGLPDGVRLRVAALDAYNGHVYNVDNNSADFPRVGQQIGAEQGGKVTTLSITLDEGYEGVWLPGGGDLRGVRFTGPDAKALADGLHYNRNTGTALTTAGLSSGVSYQVDEVVPPTPTDAELAKDSIAQLDMPEVKDVPEEIVAEAPEFGGSAESQIDMLRKIEQKFREVGYYSNDEKMSLSGHYKRRLTTMFTGAKMVGDEEQYAAAMALMVRQLGYPARVVMGFVPEQANPATSIQLTGWDVRAWVEVPFQNHGWVAFDPTPDRDKEPDTKVPKPQEVPRPQVLPPPEPPQEPVDPPEDRTDSARNQQEKDRFPELPKAVQIVGYVIAGGALLAAPFFLIGFLKKRRRLARRMTGANADRIGRGWEEILDTAVDLGHPARPRVTRRETAHDLAAAYPKASPVLVAERVDAHVFGGAEPTTAEVDAMWKEVDELLKGMRDSVGRWRRLRGSVSPRSLIHQRRAQAKARPGKPRGVRRDGELPADGGPDPSPKAKRFSLRKARG